MNIFKVLASSKNGFQEVQASGLLAWFLNPYMEHGLGFTFLKKFLQKIDESKELDKLNKILQPILRSEKNDKELKFTSDIEFKAGRSFIDIVLFINDFVISIENKIHNSSASKSEQLSLQYDGLKSKIGENCKIFMVFLVPDEMNSKVQAEFNDLNTDDKDHKVIIEWNRIREIIQEIIDEDQKSIITPIDEYLRHTLKAFSNFINDDFNGYYFETTRNYGEINSSADGRKKLGQIRQDATINQIGVKSGIFGLLLLDKEDIQTRDFQYATEKIDNYQWIQRELFIKTCDSILNNNFEELDWIENIDAAFPSEVIYRIAKYTTKEFYIGIKGGEASLNGMDKETILQKSWFVSTTKKTNQWITKEKYLEKMNIESVFG